MLPEHAEEMLKNYKTYLGRCAYLEAAIAAAEIEIRSLRAKERLDVLNAGSNGPDGMPHGTKIGNPTERIAILLITGYDSTESEIVRTEMNKLKKELRQKQLTVVLVEAWMKGLTAKERWMIERSYFDEMSYREINTQYREVHGESCSKDLLRRLKKGALGKIFEMAK